MNRRGFLTGLASIVAAPAIIRTIDLMPIKSIKPKCIIDLTLSKDYISWQSMQIDGVCIDNAKTILLLNQQDAKNNGVYRVLDR